MNADPLDLHPARNACTGSGTPHGRCRPHYFRRHSGGWLRRAGPRFQDMASPRLPGTSQSYIGVAPEHGQLHLSGISRPAGGVHQYVASSPDITARRTWCWQRACASARRSIARAVFNISSASAPETGRISFPRWSSGKSGAARQFGRLSTAVRWRLDGEGMLPIPSTPGLGVQIILALNRTVQPLPPVWGLPDGYMRFAHGLSKHLFKVCQGRPPVVSKQKLTKDVVE